MTLSDELNVSGEMVLSQQIKTVLAAWACSDVHIRVDQPIAIRADGVIRWLGQPLALSLIEDFLSQQLSEVQRQSLSTHRNLDGAIMLPPYRLRMNAFYTGGHPALVLRVVSETLPTLEGLGVPAVVAEELLSDQGQRGGLILACGPTGSGKSSSLAAMLDYINANRAGHILTLEDPVEFIHANKRSVVTQREIGSDALSFPDGLRAALREDPDVILVGELRDETTILLALTAAQTGHLVLGTLHTSSSADAINRIVGALPAGLAEQARIQLAQSLRLVLTQQLVSSPSGPGRRAAFELMLSTPAIKHLIREGKTHQIHSVMQTSRSQGMVLMQHSLERISV